MSYYHHLGGRQGIEHVEFQFFAKEELIKSFVIDDYNQFYIPLIVLKILSALRVNRYFRFARLRLLKTHVVLS